MPMYNLILYNDNYSKTFGSVWQYCKGELILNNVATITLTGAGGTKDCEIMVLLKKLRNFRRTLEMPLLNCEINLILTWSANWIISSGTAANQATTLTITDTKLYFLVVTLSTKDNAKL